MLDPIYVGNVEYEAMDTELPELAKTLIFGGLKLDILKGEELEKAIKSNHIRYDHLFKWPQ
jgi:hypothetical protein